MADQRILDDIGQGNKPLVKTVYLLDSEINYLLELIEDNEKSGRFWGDKTQFEKQRSLLKRKLEEAE